MSNTKSINEMNADLFQSDETESAPDPATIRRKAMDYLARREYGRDELAARLAGAGFDAEAVSAVVGQLADEGLQDDARFAESFVQSRISRGKGPMRIRQELKERGLSSSVIDDAIAGSGQDWCELAREVRRRKFGNELPAKFTDKAKQMRFLQYRGFEGDHIRAAVDARGAG